MAKEARPLTAAEVRRIQQMHDHARMKDDGDIGVADFMLAHEHRERLLDTLAWVLKRSSAGTLPNGEG